MMTNTTHKTTLRELDDLTNLKLTTWKIHQKRLSKNKGRSILPKTQNDESGKPTLSAKKNPMYAEMTR